MKLLQTVKSFILQYKVLLVLYILVTLFSFWQLIESEHINNFKIFRHSSFHLLSSLPLYIEYPAEYFDLFYYNPVFPVLFMPFAMLPINAGMLAWISVTALGCFFIFKYMPLTAKQNQVFIFLIMFDIMNNLTHTQTNPLLLAFMIMSWVMLQKDRPFLSALFMTLSFLIKGYGGIIGILCFYYKDWYKVVLYGIFWMVIINASLLLFVTPETMVQYYNDWFQIISSDTIKESYSVYGLTKNLHLQIPETYILTTALSVLAAFLVMHYLAGKNRVYLLAFLLIWVIVFNRASEPATYIMAMGGAILWYIIRPKHTISSIIFWTTIAVSTLIPTDIVPWFDKLRYEYYLKTVFCLLIIADMFVYTASQIRTNRMAKAMNNQ